MSVAAADAIWARLDSGVGGVSAENILKHDIDSLKGFGLSRPKARYALSVAEAERDGAIMFDALPALDDEAAIAALTGLTGIGRWTAEVYLTFCEGRLDFFPAGDVALQEGLRMADDAERRLTEKDLYLRAEAWRPHRGVGGPSALGLLRRHQARRDRCGLADLTRRRADATRCHRGVAGN